MKTKITLVYSFQNEKTGEIATCRGWQALAQLKARSLSKGHIWRELRFVPLLDGWKLVEREMIEIADRCYDKLPGAATDRATSEAYHAKRKGAPVYS